MENISGDIYVSTDGHDGNPGTLERPFATLSRAKLAIYQRHKKANSPVTVVIRGGTYYQEEPLTFNAKDSGTPEAPITYTAFPGEQVTISGGKRLSCRWKPYQDGIWMCELEDFKEGKLNFTQLFVNGKRQVRARYPNYDDSDPKNFCGYILAAGEIDHEIVSPWQAPDQDMTFSGELPRGINFDPNTFSKRRWNRPEEAIIHIFQANYWGNLQWHIKSIDWDHNRIWFGSGGQQMNGACNVNKQSHFYIENILEELDSPGEWYLDGENSMLYYMPSEEIDLERAVIEVPELPQIIRLIGSQEQSVHDITLEGFRFAHTTTTFMEEYCIPSRSDWSIHRGGAVFLEGTKNCLVKDCCFDAVGGNAVFMNGYNRGNRITGCKFVKAGDSAICFVGHSETTVGSQKRFPYECCAENNLIHDCGIFGKQIAGVYISRAKRITVSHNEIYKMPRAGICIGDGTWGGHIIEYNHIHNTCLETSDHGPFNSWGRDNNWCFAQAHLPYITKRSHDIVSVKTDGMEPVIIHHNFFEENSSWGVDLDDGSSNYEVYNNLCLGVSIKLREGTNRTIYNNIWVYCANAPSFHVGYEGNHDRYFRNITVMKMENMKPELDVNFSVDAQGEVYSLFAPPVHGPWLEEIDYNCFFSDLGEFVAWVRPRTEGGFDENWKEETDRSIIVKYTLEQWQALGYDKHSIFADPLFVNPGNKDYRLLPESPANKIGFISFDGREAGLTKTFPTHLLENSEFMKPMVQSSQST